MANAFCSPKGIAQIGQHKLEHRSEFSKLPAFLDRNALRSNDCGIEGVLLSKEPITNHRRSMILYQFRQCLPLSVFGTHTDVTEPSDPNTDAMQSGSSLIIPDSKQVTPETCPRNDLSGHGTREDRVQPACKSRFSLRPFLTSCAHVMISTTAIAEQHSCLTADNSTSRAAKQVYCSIRKKG